ncbi:MAG TPA: class D sortase [Bryobacterales bacterium]|nr:class D sortase [Bryobacterales bacterium]
MRVHIHFGKGSGQVSRQFLRSAERIFLVCGLLALGACAVIYSDAYIYQAYEGHRFAQALERSVAGKQPGPPPAADLQARDGAVIGRLDIPRLGLRVMVREGDRFRTLRVAAGHIPGTAMPGWPGNVGIAAHRDTFFRDLRKIRLHDTITVTTLAGSYRYSVDSIRIVKPADTQVLEASGGPSLTLVTCYPFSYVGAAPKRFIVRARQMSGDNGAAARTAS